MVQIHANEPPGDILVFLTGEEEIEDACKKVNKECMQMGDQVSLCDAARKYWISMVWALDDHLGCRLWDVPYSTACFSRHGLNACFLSISSAGLLQLDCQPFGLLTSLAAVRILLRCFLRGVSAVLDCRLVASA